MTSISMFGSVIGSQFLISSLERQCLVPDFKSRTFNENMPYSFFFVIYLFLIEPNEDVNYEVTPPRPKMISK